MTEQELRSAVAEYDAELAQSMQYDDEAGLHVSADTVHGVMTNWIVGPAHIEIEVGCVVMASDVIQSHAATMRAMDEALAAFNAAFDDGEA